ncbi:hydroxyacylglutathione hydrolase [Pseudomonas laurentiana]
MSSSTGPLQVYPLEAFTDNYIWLLASNASKTCVVVDPGDAEPVIAWLSERPDWRLSDVLVTHHHSDHVGGLKTLKAATNCTIHGPLQESIPMRDHGVVHGDLIRVLDRWVNVLGVPGHTAGHLAYQLPQERMLFSGDTLFSAGCGRLFEGTPAQMLTSLDALAALPGCTRVFCAHEYTVPNLRFALAVEPENLEIAQRLAEASVHRKAGLSTLPTTIAVEREINPFLRVRQENVIKAAEQYARAPITTPVACFSVLRAWKDNF